MPKVLFRLLLTVLTFTAAAVGLQAPSLAAETTLRITLQLPLRSQVGQNVAYFKEEVERLSEGVIAVQIFDSAQLYKDKDVPQAVGSGAINMGVASLTRYVGEVPAVDIFYLPFMFNSEALVRAATALESRVRGPLDEAILATGSRVLWWLPNGGAILLSKGEAGLRRPADIADQKVRVFGKTVGDFVSAVGGVPTLISGSEQYLAYQRGTVDVGMTSIAGVEARKLHEVMDSVTVTNHAHVEFLVLINEDFWQSLPAEQQEIIQTAARSAEVRARDEIAEIEAAAYAEAAKQGMAVIELTADEVAAWRNASEPVLQGYLADSGALGKQVLEAAQALEAQ